METGSQNDVHGWNIHREASDKRPLDDLRHGTHVAGSIAAVGNNGQGIAGVNWQSSIMAVKILDEHAMGYLADAIEAVNYVTEMRQRFDVDARFGADVRIVNMSWISQDGFSVGLEDAIRAAGKARIRSGSPRGHTPSRGAEGARTRPPPAT